MNEEVKMYMDEAKEQMQNALVHLENELAKIRAGKANPKILNDVLVDYYGSPTPLSRLRIHVQLQFSLGKKICLALSKKPL